MTQVAGGRRMWPAVFLTALLAAGCSANPAADAELRAVMSALGPTPMVVGLERRERWLLRGNPEPGQLSIALDEGLPAVLAVAGSGEFSAGHWVNLHLLAVPYLTWRWKMASHPGPFHPVRLAVGFADTGGEDGKVPDARRELELVWSDKALKRGFMDAAGDGRAARYVVRGGEEALGRQWEEGVDLVSLHDRAWPGVSTSRTRIVFVIVRAADYDGPPPPPAALISDINLLR